MLGRHRYLFEQLVRRELRQKYQGSALGIAWYLVNPLVLMGAYYLMFGRIFKVVSHPDYPLFLMVGLVVWIFFSQSLLSAAPSLLDQGSLVRKARFPRETIPGSVVAVQFVTFAVIFSLLAVVTVAVRGTLAPVVLAALLVFVTGLAFGISVLHAYYRDVAPILSAVLLPWFFVSPIFFDVGEVFHNEGARIALTWLNPIAPYITALRDVVYGGVAPTLATLLYVVAGAAIALAGGLSVFRRMQAELAVVV